MNYRQDSSDGISFSISSRGEELFNHTFKSVVDAQLFFTDRVVNLGLLASGAQELFITTTFEARATSDLSFRYVFGVSPVPEPQTWLLMVAGSAVLLARARRRKA